MKCKKQKKEKERKRINLKKENAKIKKYEKGNKKKSKVLNISEKTTDQNRTKKWIKL